MTGLSHDGADGMTIFGITGNEGIGMTMAVEEGLGISIAAVWDESWVGDIWASVCTRKRMGEQAEAAFLNKATSLGLSVAMPWGDSERYDLIVGSGPRTWRVQVKSTRYVGERRFSITARGCTDAYTEDEIDFLAAYIVPLDIWYIIPVKAFSPRKCLRLYPEGESLRGRYEKYREAWWLFGGAGQRQPPSVLAPDRG
jgi:PD-(D/E)XK endonuclease